MNVRTLLRTAVIVSIVLAEAAMAKRKSTKIACLARIPNGQHRSIDDRCPIYGSGSADPDDPQGMQNRAKNNFCANGMPMTINLDTFGALQRAVDRLSDVIQWREPHEFPKNRKALQKIGPDGVGEGTVVRFAGVVLQAHYSDVGQGESANCKQSGQANNDILVVLSDKLRTDRCMSIVAEISPHYRPAVWVPEQLNTLGSRPVRITGQLFFDASHLPCGYARTKDSGAVLFPRLSTWEIHPVYAIDVCTSGKMDECDPSNDRTWVPLERFVSK